MAIFYSNSNTSFQSIKESKEMEIYICVPFFDSILHYSKVECSTFWWSASVRFIIEDFKISNLAIIQYANCECGDTSAK